MYSYDCRLFAYSNYLYLDNCCNFTLLNEWNRGWNSEHCHDNCFLLLSHTSAVCLVIWATRAARRVSYILQKELSVLSAVTSINRPHIDPQGHLRDSTMLPLWNQHTRSLPSVSSFSRLCCVGAAASSCALGVIFFFLGKVWRQNSFFKAGNRHHVLHTLITEIEFRHSFYVAAGSRTCWLPQMVAEVTKAHIGCVTWLQLTLHFPCLFGFV